MVTFLQFGRQPVNVLIRASDIKNIVRSSNLREIVLRTYNNEAFTEAYQEFEQSAFDARWSNIRTILNQP